MPDFFRTALYCDKLVFSSNFIHDSFFLIFHKSLCSPPNKLSIIILILATDTAIEQTDEMVADLDQGHEAEAHAESHDAPDIGDGVDDGGVLVNLDPRGKRFPDEHRQDGGIVLGLSLIHI